MFGYLIAAVLVSIIPFRLLYPLLREDPSKQLWEPNPIIGAVKLPEHRGLETRTDGTALDHFVPADNSRALMSAQVNGNL